MTCCVPSEPAPECHAEGETFETFGGDPDAMRCEGIEALSQSVPAAGGCAQPKCPCFVCTACGDGACGKGENECNCPADCGG